MDKGGIGVGSASIVLVFVVLCLTVFALISLAAASNDKVMADKAADIVKGYYEADALAERVLAEILLGSADDTVLGVEVSAEYDTYVKYVTFACPISDKKELFVKAAIYRETCDVLEWSMRDVGSWVMIDEMPPVWTGD